MSRIRGPYVRFCERDEAETPHPTRYACNLRPVDLCCTYFTQQYIGSHIIENASDTILA